MIYIDLELFEEADVELEVVLQKAKDISTRWAVENKFFSILKDDPQFDNDEMNALIQRVTKAESTMKAFLATLVPKPAARPGMRATPNHPNFDKSPEEKLVLLKGHVVEFKEAYDALTEYRHEKSFLGSIENQIVTSVNSLEAKMSTKLERKVNELLKTTSEQIETGIKDLIGLKSELGLAKQFGGKITTELKEAKSKEQNFMIAFICTLLLIPILVIVEHFTLTSLDLISSYVVKGSIAISLLFVSYFFFSQYRTYMMIRLRYTHLDGFLGGGATFIAQLLKSDNPELQLEVNKKLAELFMNLDDVLSVVQKSKHPTELSLDKAESIFDKITKMRS